MEYGEFVGMIDIKTMEMIEGDLPKRALDMVKEWGELHKAELEAIWKTQKFSKLPPLD